MHDGDGLFSGRDLRLFRATALLATAVTFAGLVILIFWILGRVLSHFYNLLFPLAVAAVLALVLYPVVNFFQRKLGIRRLFAVILLYLIMLCVLVVTWALVLPEMVNQGKEMALVGPELVARVYEGVTGRFPRVTEAVQAQLEDADLTAWAPDVEGMRERTMSYLGLIVGLGFVPLYLFFMLLAGRKMKTNSQELISVFSTGTQNEITFLITKFIDYVTAFFQGQLIIALIMAVMYAIGFTLVGLQAAILIGLFMGLMNIVPFLGTILGLLIALPIAWIQPDGGLHLVGWVLLVFAVVQLVESWVLTPRIMSEKSGLHPAIVVISLFFWGTALGGVIGMILAVPLSAFLVSLWWHVKSNYFNAVVSESTTVEEPSQGRIIVDEPDNSSPTSP